LTINEEYFTIGEAALKFKFIVITFNIIIVLFLSVVALAPVFLFGFQAAVSFWRSGWPLALVLAAALISLNAFFLLNRRLFKLLEREDWPALIDYLEQRVIQKGRYSPRLVRLLLNSYLVMSASGGVMKLENKLALAKPALLEEHALVFGAARILEGDSKGAAEFFQLRLEKGKNGDAQWLRWYYGFSLTLTGAFDRAEAEFRTLTAASGDALITGLSAYFLSAVLSKHSSSAAECRSLAGEGRERVQKALKNPEGWKREAARIETEVYAAVVKKYIDEAGRWLFA
jgi:hypothetical protein